jgi:hypothetical protein
MPFFFIYNHVGFRCHELENVANPIVQIVLSFALMACECVTLIMWALDAMNLKMLHTQ